MAEKSQDTRQSASGGVDGHSVKGAHIGDIPVPAAFRRGFPTIGDLLAFVGIFFVSQLIAAIIALAFGIPMPDIVALKSTDEAIVEAARLNIGHFNAVTVFFSLVIMIVGFLIYRRFRKGPSTIGRFSAKGFNPMLLLWGVIMLFSVSVVADPLMRLLPAVPDVYGRGMWAMIAVVVMAPVFEELLFRGILLESVRSRWGVVWAWFISALIFGICHGHPALIVNAFVMGLVLSFIYIKTESLFSVVIIHAVNNAVAFLAITLGLNNTSLGEMISSRTVYVLVYLVALAVFIGSAYMIYYTLRKLAMREKTAVDK